MELGEMINKQTCIKSLLLLLLVVILIGLSAYSANAALEVGLNEQRGVIFTDKDFVFNGTISCHNITGGTDPDYCIDSDSGGVIDFTALNASIKAVNTSLIRSNVTQYLAINKLNLTTQRNNVTVTNQIISLRASNLTIWTKINALLTSNTSIWLKINALLTSNTTSWNAILGLRASNLTKAMPGNCPSGKVVMNTTTGGVQCVTPTSSFHTHTYANITDNQNMSNTRNITNVNKLSFGETAVNLYMSATGKLKTNGIFLSTGYMSGSYFVTANNANIYGNSYMALSSTSPIKWSSDATYYGTTDVGISRGAVGNLYIGNGVAGNSQGNLTANKITANKVMVSSDLNMSNVGNITNVNRLGVGTSTSSASAKLTVAGNVNLTNTGAITNVNNLDIGSAVLTSGVKLSIDSPTSGASAGQTMLQITRTGVSGIRLLNYDGSTGVSGFSWQGGSAGVWNDLLHFNVANAGSIGIGLRTTTSKLDINGSTRIRQNLNMSNVGNISNVNKISTNTIKLGNDVWQTTMDGKQRFYFFTNSITYIEGTGIVFRGSADTNLISIDDTGNLGVGIKIGTSLTTKLDVNGTTRLRDNLNMSGTSQRGGNITNVNVGWFKKLFIGTRNVNDTLNALITINASTRARELADNSSQALKIQSLITSNTSQSVQIAGLLASNLTKPTPAYFFAYRTTSTTITALNKWYDYNWTVVAPQKVGFTHSNTASMSEITVTVAGTYLFTWDLTSLSTAGASQYTTRLLDDGVEIAGSHHMWLSPVTALTGGVETSIIATVEAGSVIEVQVGSNGASSQIVYNDPVNLPDATTFASAHITITRLA